VIDGRSICGPGGKGAQKRATATTDGTQKGLPSTAMLLELEYPRDPLGLRPETRDSGSASHECDVKAAAHTLESVHPRSSGTWRHCHHVLPLPSSPWPLSPRRMVLRQYTTSEPELRVNPWRTGGRLGSLSALTVSWHNHSRRQGRSARDPPILPNVLCRSWLNRMAALSVRYEKSGIRAVLHRAMLWLVFQTLVHTDSSRTTRANHFGAGGVAINQWIGWRISQ
jgi:hypothetical protein